jgi:8-oxo-dGTP pyrophosphatase MutT (NUDIX family)
MSMAKTAKRTGRSDTRQVAALPWRMGASGLEILVITSRETRRWVIPKGGRMAGKTDAQAAAQEAFEEAGVHGAVGGTSIGHFRYSKIGRNGDLRRYVVAVYPLEVLVQLGDWPEAHQRERRWMTKAEAEEAVGELDLKALIRGFEATAVLD